MLRRAQCTTTLIHGKWELAHAASRAAGSPLGSWAAAAATYIAVSCVLVGISAALVLGLSPVAAGSGISEVKAYLQGVRVPRLLRTTTLIAKTCGVLCSVAGGLLVGKEGPMIHAGAIVAAGASQGNSKTCNCRTTWLKRFRNDHDKRDFVSAGAAAGVAAAFGAPIGGVLFAVEEAALYWSQSLTWRTFFCALASTLTLNLVLSARAHHNEKVPFGELSHPGLITFGTFNGRRELYNMQARAPRCPPTRHAGARPCAHLAAAHSGPRPPARGRTCRSSFCSA